MLKAKVGNVHLSSSRAARTANDTKPINLADRGPWQGVAVFYFEAFSGGFSTDG